MIAEPTVTPYTDEALGARIAENPKPDADGLAPDEDGWVETFDLNRTASQIWIEKAGALAGSYDVNADGGSYSRSQKHANAVKMAGYYASRSAVRVFHLDRRGSINRFNDEYQTLESQT